MPRVSEVKSSVIQIIKGKTNAPSVMLIATKNKEKGGSPNLAVRVANAADRMTYGATILKILERKRVSKVI
jgi:hypothetical protein